MKLWLSIVMMVGALAVIGCSSSADEYSRGMATPAQHDQCRKAEFDHAALRLCATRDVSDFYCFYCVDQRGVMWPFEDKTE